MLLEMERRTTQAEVGRPPPSEPGGACPRCATKELRIDYSSLTTEELQTLYEAARILDGAQKERPPLLVPPTGPTRRKAEGKEEEGEP
jgi:hypothetical protein